MTTVVVTAIVIFLKHIHSNCLFGKDVFDGRDGVGREIEIVESGTDAISQIPRGIESVSESEMIEQCNRTGCTSYSDRASTYRSL